MLALGYLVIFAGALVLVAGLTGSSLASVAQGKPDRAKAGGPVGVSPPASASSGAGSPSAGESSNPIRVAAHEFGGILPIGARVLRVARKDQGRDLQLEPGQELLSPGWGSVLRVGSDPSGFGPAYPILHMTSGPYAGQDIYYGHVDSAVHAGETVTPGQVVAHTSRSGHNAPPGWLEFGFAPGGSPGPFGQHVPF